MENENELREIEARIAQELFGWRIDKGFGGVYFVKDNPASFGGVDIAREPPRYARQLLGAMAAAEKMRERGWAYSLHSPLQNDTAFTFFMKPSEERADLSRVARMALTDAEAIARCIVAALDAEAKQNP